MDFPEAISKYLGLRCRVGCRLAVAVLIQRRVRCWNIRTLRDEGVQALTMRILGTYRVDVAGLSDVRLPGTGQTSIKVPGADTFYHLFHSGVTDISSRHSVAVALSPVAYAALLDWKPISTRLARIRLKDSNAYLSIISVYTLTLDDAEGGPCAAHRACCSRHPKVKQLMGDACKGPGPRPSRLVGCCSRCCKCHAS